MSLRGVLLVVGSCLAVAPPASASTVSYDAATDTLTFTAAPGEANDVSITTRLPRELMVSDTGATLSAGAGCNAGAPVSCFATYGNAVRVVVNTGDQADRFSLNGNLIGCLEPVISAGDGDDHVQSSPFQNCPDVLQMIDGGPGNDTIEGTMGAHDDLRGGDGTDTIDYSRNAGDVLVDLESEDPVSGLLDEGDVLTGFENGRGGSGDDYLIGTDTANLLDGGGGDDLIDGGAGADTLAGGAGEDVVDYSLRLEPLTVYLDGSRPAGGASDGTGDALSGIEDVWSGRGNDTLIGDANDNLFNGGRGADLLVGGPGDDYADYSERLEPVTVKLEDAPTSGSASDGPPGARDTLREIENLYGGEGNDTLTGSSAPNLIDAGGGDDTIDVYDGVRDEVDCGAGTNDSARGDLSDVAIGPDCETFARTTFLLPPKFPAVVQPPVVTPPVAPPALVVTLELGRLPTLARALSRGLAVTGTCSRGCRVIAELRLDKQAARRLGFKRAVTIAKGSAARSGKVTLKFTSAARRALKRARRVKAALTVSATGADGKVVVARRTLTLKR